MNRSNLDRRAFLSAAAQVTGAIGALVIGQEATEARPESVGGSAAPKPPFRVGFQRILDPSAGEKSPWYVNDHCFIRATDGTWHVFGITHQEPADPNHEIFLLHATAPDVKGPWKKIEPVMHVDTNAGETVIWAPHVVAHDSKYWMLYCAGGKSHADCRIHLATSTDLFTWQRHPANPMVVDGFDARDPMVLRVGDEWVLYYTATEHREGGHHVVAAVTSRDLIHWSNRRIVFRSPVVGTYGGPTESPFVVAKDGRYYLFVCTNDPYNNTAVYVSDSHFHWNPADILLNLGAHAAEVIRVDEDRWYISRAGWRQGGLYIADLD